MFRWWSTKQPDLEALRAQIINLLRGAPLNLETFQIDDGRALAVLAVNGADAPGAEPVRARVEAMLRGQTGIKTVQVILTAQKSDQPLKIVKKPEPKAPEKLAVGVTYIIAVASGKGGVGKSTVATNLAVVLAQMGIKTGLLDADIYGPSIPMMMGQTGVKPDKDKDGRLIPIQAHNVACMSIGFMVDPEAPMIWRGPMVQSAIVQMLRDVDWMGTEVLVVDLPPGTGDAQLTFAQKLPMSGVVIVSTPQDVALIDARKALLMFQQVHVPILGIIENMSVFTCPNCGHASDIFGHGGAAREAEKQGVDFLGDLPLDLAARVQSDAGVPIVAAEPSTQISVNYRTIADLIYRKLRYLNTNQSDSLRPLPTIRMTD